MSPKPRRGRLIPAFIACFYAGVAVGWWVHASVGDDGEEPRTLVTETKPEATSGTIRTPSAPLPLGAPDASARRSDESVVSTVDVPKIGTDPIAELRRHALRLPIDEVKVEEMEGDFAQPRSGGARSHEAVDILAPRHTPIYAVDDGTIARLFFSNAGGITIYQFDPTSRYCYYYAHLQRYAPGLKEGMQVEKGDVIGYVGTTGNAPPDTPHLHFAIFQVTDGRRWWEGRPIDPYLVYRDRP